MARVLGAAHLRVHRGRPRLAVARPARPGAPLIRTPVSRSRAPRLRALLLPLLAGALGAGAPLAPRTDATANDHRTLAGTLARGDFTLALTLTRAAWRPNGPRDLAVDVAAFAEEGRAPAIPGPLIRVPAGTRMAVTVRNALAERATVHGLHDHEGARDSVVLAPGEVRTVRFVATRPGTYAYLARTTVTATLLSRRDDAQLVGAFVVDSAGRDPRAENRRERVLVISAWDDTVANPASPYGMRQVYAINGRSWPFTERLAYREGEVVRWRVLNLSQHSHPMHLHGTYFRVLARGTPFTDTTFAAAREVVTELLLVGQTMTMAWTADRPGNWLFHCHTINHIDEALRLGAAATASAHASHANVTDVMAGLVMAMTVRPTGKVAATPTPHRRLRLVVTERAAPAGGHPRFAYVLQRDAREPAPDSLELPGSTLELVQGEPTAITVVNRSRQATAVHWHGMELQSRYDGVAGWSGAGARVAPLIAPGDSFTAHMTPPRAGTFIYHTHAGELAQLSGGLYGALIVRPRDARPDPLERLLVLGDSTTDSLRARGVPSIINGRSVPMPIELVAGATHVLRVISIGAVSLRRLRLLDGDTLVHWTPVAKDGAEWPAERQVAVPAQQLLGAGETMDLRVTPLRAGELVLEVTALYGPPIVTRVPVRVRAAP